VVGECPYADGEQLNPEGRCAIMRLVYDEQMEVMTRTEHLQGQPAYRVAMEQRASLAAGIAKPEVIQAWTPQGTLRHEHLSGMACALPQFLTWHPLARDLTARTGQRIAHLGEHPSPCAQCATPSCCCACL